MHMVTKTFWDFYVRMGARSAVSLVGFPSFLLAAAAALPYVCSPAAKPLEVFCEGKPVVVLPGILDQYLSSMCTSMSDSPCTGMVCGFIAASAAERDAIAIPVMSWLRCVVLKTRSRAIPVSSTFELTRLQEECFESL